MWRRNKLKSVHSALLNRRIVSCFFNLFKSQQNETNRIVHALLLNFRKRRKRTSLNWRFNLNLNTVIDIYCTRMQINAMNLSPAPSCMSYITSFFARCDLLCHIWCVASRLSLERGSLGCAISSFCAFCIFKCKTASAAGWKKRRWDLYLLLMYVCM